MLRLFLLLNLFVFWFINSEKTYPLFFLFGIISVIITYKTAKLLGVYEKEYNHLNSFRFFYQKRSFKYLFWLMKEVFLSSVNVTRLVLSNKSKIKPEFGNLSTKLDNNVSKTIYANSITLTPGTVCIDIQNNEIKVHALEKSSVKDLKNSDIEKRISEL